MAAGVDINRSISSVWQKILTVVNNALVYLDDPAAELLHWSGNVASVIEAGALAIHDLSSRRGGNESETKAVFIITTVLHGETLDDVRAIVQASDFQHVTVLCSVPENINSFARRSSDTQEEAAFGELSQKLREWMGNEYSTVDVHHVALFPAQVYPGLFIAPAFYSFFPLLPSDVPRLQGFLHSTGEKKVFNNLSEIEMTSLPHNLQLKIKMFASGLSSMFELLEVSEDCYGMGYLSKLIASELANIPSARGRRKTATGRASLVLMDRTLDLVGPCGHSSDTLADKVIQLLPRLPGHQSDVTVDMSTLCSAGSVTPSSLAPGCLAHAHDQSVQALLNSLFTKRQKDSLNEIARHLNDALSKESVSPISRGSPGKVNSEHLHSLAQKFKGQPKAFKSCSGLLQIAMAAVSALKHKNLEHMEDLLSNEKVLLMNMGEEESESIIAEILGLLKTEKVKELYSLEDILLLVGFVYSLRGDECYASPAEEELLKKILVDCLLRGDLECTTEGYLGTEPNERNVRKKIADAFEKLRGIAEARRELRQFGRVYQEATAIKEPSYQPLVKQVIDAIFSAEKPELVDVEFKSHGIKDFIKTGFSLFMNVSKPRPNDLPLLVFFIIGGVTCSEVKQIKEAVTSHHPNTQVIIGSTRILKSEDVFQQVFCQDNLFPLLS
ncbi:sec1 family domain-containing protein 2 [Nematostella vectensis]|uniref:sec1 family domain-containing protein 2 n=1 Tax=Nematostella vectensis TaxID=45351 RepID=UPI0020771AB9|nr:sec1 family domain-containing protein 2 [Nematostella vectensis]